MFVAVRLLVVCGMAAALVAVVPSIGSATADRTVLEPTSRRFRQLLSGAGRGLVQLGGRLPVRDEPDPGDR